MHALVAAGYGDVDQLEYREVAEPRAAPGEVKVKVAAAGINPIDWKLLAGTRRQVMPLQFPAILGRDCAGEVIEVGQGVTAFKKGDRVLGLAWHTFAEQVVGPESAWAKLPPGLDPRQAASLPLVVLTGAQLADTVRPRAGMVVLVTGAYGGVGRTAAFVCRRAGARVLAGVLKSQLDISRGLRADLVLALDDDAAIEKLPELDAVCDTVNGETIAKLLPHVKKDGVVGRVVGEPPKAKELGIRAQAILTRPDGPRLGELASAAAQGELLIPVVAQLPLSEGRNALKFARDDAQGKVVLLP
jgi:NADPH:quinone reductase-like Zn-dependent oxidoreductase